MFKKLEVLENTNTIYDFNSTKEELINEIERLLIENKEIITILKNKDESYSIYCNKDLEDDFIVDPIITFFENDDLIKVLNFLRMYIDNKVLLNKTISTFKEKIQKNYDNNQNSLNYVSKKLNEINELIYSDKNESKKIYNIINKIIEESNNYYEFADNFRFAQVGNKYQELIYQQLEQQGCCGYYDRIIDVDGIEYKIGFNYGH